MHVIELWTQKIKKCRIIETISKAGQNIFTLKNNVGRFRNVKRYLLTLATLPFKTGESKLLQKGQNKTGLCPWFGLTKDLMKVYINVTSKAFKSTWYI